MLEKNQINADSYQQELESWLLRLRREIEDTVRPAGENPAALEGWERLLQETSSFYYRSFHERFFPLYRSSIRQEVSTLLKISSQEDMIKTDLIAGLKRSARLYNQLKRLTSLLGQWQADNRRQLPDLGRCIDRNRLELFYAGQGLQASLRELEEAARDFKLLAADKELLAALERSNLSFELFALTAAPDRSDPLPLGHWQQVSSSLHALRNSLSKLPPARENGPGTAGQLINRALRELGDILDQGGSKWELFRKQVYQNLLLRAQALSLCLQAGHDSQAGQLAQEFMSYLQDLISVLDRSRSLKGQDPGRLLPAAGRTARLDPDYPARLLDTVSAVLKKLDSLIDSYSQTTDSDWAYFSSQLEDILDSAAPLCPAAGGMEQSALEALLIRVNLEISFLRARIDLLRESNRQSSALFSRLTAIDKILEAHLGHLTDIKSDLERLLAPRNLSRFWKDRLVRVDRIPLEKGQLFPAEHLHLLDKYRVETRVSGPADNIILDEQGDIFIIRIDESVEEELPYFVVSKAGR